MAKYNSAFYEGGNYGLDPNYGSFLGLNYRTPLSNLATTTDPRTANQLKAVAEKLRAGIKTVEVSMLSPEVAESIPNQHLEEMNRLRKLTGAELTLHAPVVEPTGFGKQGWNEQSREQSVRQMWSALERSNKIDPGGNVVVTFHSSAGLPEGEVKVFNEETKKEELKEVYVIDERSGKYGALKVEPNYLTGEKMDSKALIDKHNEESWVEGLRDLKQYTHRAMEAVDNALELHHSESSINAMVERFGEEKTKKFLEEEKAEGKEKIEELYSRYSKGDISLKDIEELTKKDWFKRFNSEEIGDQGAATARQRITNLEYGEVNLRGVYQNFQKLFNDAYKVAEDNDDKKSLEKLKGFAKEIAPSVKDLKEPGNVSKLAEELEKGIHLLKQIAPPQNLRSMNDFAIEKASETFSNLAVRAYDEFGKGAPIIAIENPPAGMGLSRAEDLKKLIEESRDKFVEKATKEFNMSASEAEEKAKKLIGATWDVGHINMLKKYGYTDKELEKQTEKIAKFVKKVHLSDNFGMEHTELPMGMGNVPIKREMEILDKHAKKVKKIIEAGNWYQHFQTTPLAESLEAFGSPVYGMKMAPYWNQASGVRGGYFAGYGNNPEIHHSIYGAGFANLPVELGGQMAGKSRVSGAPID